MRIRKKVFMAQKLCKYLYNHCRQHILLSGHLMYLNVIPVFYPHDNSSPPNVMVPITDCVNQAQLVLPV